jgi:hypothetical protein
VAIEVLDAIPADVHARLAITKGALQRVGYCWQANVGVQWGGVDGIQHATEFPVYRLTNPTEDL